MKYLKTYLTITLLVVSFGLGCKSPEATAYHSLGAIAISVDAAVNSYYEYRNAGHFDAVVDAKIKENYQRYQKLMLTARDMEISYKSGTIDQSQWTQLFDAASSAASDLVNFIRTFLPKVKPIK